MSDRVEELRRELDRAKRLAEASYALHTTLDLDELLGRILEVAAGGVDAERGTVYLLSEDGSFLWSRVLSGDERLEISLPVGQGIAGAVAKSGEAVRIEDAYSDPRFDRSWDERSGYRTRSILCAPIRNREGEVAGVFQLLNKRSGPFDGDDEAYLEALSVHAALAVENARLHASALEKERYDREVSLAQDVQRQLQPERLDLQRGALAVAAMNELCEDATGDYYDLLPDLPRGRLGVAIGDVAGHGLQAALVMAEARAFLRAYLRSGTAPHEALALVNDSLVPDLTGGRFLSLFAAVLDPETGALEWSNAGHNPPLLRRATGETRELSATGAVLGIVEPGSYRPGEALALDPGDLLLLYTDGVTEARSPDGELFGTERLTHALGEAGGAGGPEAGAVLAALRERVRTWTAGEANEDDLTMLVVART